LSPNATGTVRVQSGDTLYSIARANGVTVEDLATANGIGYPYAVRIGQSLRLPGAPRTVATPGPARQVRSAGASTHSVAPGETLYGVARKYGVNVSDLAAANGLTTASGIRIGQRLTIPDGSFRRETAIGGPLNKVGTPVAGAAPKTVAPAPVETRVARNDATESIGPLPAPPTRAASSFRWPVRGRLISRFGSQTDGSRNDGINISVPEGTSVKASENGVVAYAGSELKGYGNLVLIRHTDDWVTAYAHNGEILVKRGETVQRGQIIAKAGKTGSVTKPQVHFEVRKGAKAVDPLTYLEGA
jgi:murein DD-endopeptidase MepM/ murein hydrolase activator NlpD